MASSSSLKRAGVIVAALVGMVGLSSVGKQIVQQMANGSFLAQGNFVCDTSVNPNCGLVSGLYPAFIPVSAQNTATGGLAKYDTILLCSPFAATPAKGLKTGSGVVHDLGLHIAANAAQNKYDCAVVGGAEADTGSTLLHLFEDATGTGTIVLYQSGFVLGPAQCVKCGSGLAPAAAGEAVLRGWMSYSDVVN